MKKGLEKRREKQRDGWGTAGKGVSTRSSSEALCPPYWPKQPNLARPEQTILQAQVLLHFSHVVPCRPKPGPGLDACSSQEKVIQWQVSQGRPRGGGGWRRRGGRAEGDGGGYLFSSMVTPRCQLLVLHFDGIASIWQAITSACSDSVWGPFLSLTPQLLCWGSRTLFAPSPHSDPTGISSDV